MKKLLTVTLLLAGLLALAGCGSSKTNKSNKSAEATTESAYDEAVAITPVEVTANEYVELGDYKGLTIDVEKNEVTDADVEEEINNYLEGYADYETISDRDTVKEGDYVNVDYVCTIDGKKSDDYSDSDVDVKAGDGEINEYLGYGLGDDFDLESKVIGAKVGSSVKTDFTFPADYDDASVAGKNCSMEVFINSISKEVIPELTEEFVKNYTESKSVDEYKKDVRQTLEEQAEEEAEEMAREQLWKKVVDNAKQTEEFTPEMVAQELENVKAESQEVAEFYYGMTVEEFVKETTGMTMEEYAKYSLKGQCVEDLLMEAEKIEITDEDLKEEKQEIAKESGLDNVDEVTEIYSEDEIRSNLVAKKLNEKLLEYNKINYVKAKE
jgi:trigger factor